MTVGLLEALLKCLDIRFDVTNELGLVLRDSAPDLGPHEKWVELGEDPEHLVGCSGRC